MLNKVLRTAVGALGYALLGAVFATTAVAQLPATIDTNSGDEDVIIYGDTGDALSRAGAVAVGDVNGDGVDDILVGASKANGPLDVRSDCGEAYIYFGNSSLSGTKDVTGASGALPDVVVYGAGAFDELTSDGAIALGDVDGDGIADIILGASGADGPSDARFAAGEVYIIYGSASLSASYDLNTGDEDVVVYGATAFDGLTSSGALHVGDVNGDGIADLLLGAYLADGPSDARDSCGETYIIYGSGSIAASIDLNTSGEDVTIYGAFAGDELAFSGGMTTADVNGDGMGDLIVGAPSSDSVSQGRENAGEVYIIYGSGSLGSTIDLNSSSADVTVHGATAFDNLRAPRALRRLDLNGDGVDDIVLYASAASGPSDARSSAGEVYAIFGLSSLSSSIDLNSSGEDVTIYGATANDFLADRDAVASGDINSDGFDDLVLGARSADGPSDGRSGCGEVYVLYGSSSMAASYDFNSGDEDVLVYGASNTDLLTSTGSLRVGDITGDGLDDLILCAFQADGPANGRIGAGEVYLIYGSASLAATFDLNSSDEDVTVFGATTSDALGEANALALGQLDGDGLFDLLMGSAGGDGPSEGRDAAGEAYVVWGSGAATAASVVRTNHASNPLSKSYGSSRVDIDFSSGSANSTTTATLTRNDTGISNLGAGGLADVANVRWEITSDRSSFSSVVAFHYLDSEIAGIEESDLKVFQASALSGAWTQVATQSIDMATNTVTATITSFSFFALQGALDITAPTVSSVAATTSRTVDVSFSETMGTGSTTASNYTLSGTGQGSLSANPDSVSLVSGSTYRLTWNAGEMLNAGNITITVASAQDAAGVAIGSPDNGTDTGGGIGVAPTVSSVAVVSASAVDVTFSEAMGTGVTTASNYAVSGAGSGSLSTNPDSVALQSGNTYRLTWTSGEMVTGGTITVTVSSVQDLVGHAIGSPNSGSHVSGGIGVAPSVSTVDVTTGSVVEVTFSEAMGSGVTTASNYTISGPGKGSLTTNPDSVALVGGSTYSLTWSAGEMVNGSTVTITVANAQDTVGNVIGSPTSGSETSGGIGVRPTVTSVDVQSISEIDITFSEAMGSSATTASFYTVSGAGRGTLAANPDTAVFVSGTTYRLTWSSGEMINGSNVTVTATTNIKDVAGNRVTGPNAGTDAGLGVAPTVSSVAVQSSSTVDVTFSETMGSAVTTATNYTVSGTGKGTLSNNPNSVAIVSGGTYRLTWTSGEMLGGFNITITVINAQDAAGNVVGSPDNGTHTGGALGVAPTVTTVAVQSGSQVDVTFSESMGSGVTTASNFALSGTGKGSLSTNPNSAALQSGNTYRLTWTSGEMLNGGDVTITVSNVQDSVGNVVGSPNSDTDTAGGVGVAPTVSSVAVQSASTIDVVFSENMGSSATVAGNYAVSGAGAGSLTTNPASVALQGGSTYRLTWTSGEMLSGGDITITTSSAADVAGNPVGSPNSGTDTSGGIGVAPTVSSVTVPSAATVDVTFSEAMGTGVTTAANYTVSGTGLGTLSATPNSAVLSSGNTYRLTWTSGEMLTGGNITVTVASVQDAVGNTIGSPNSGTATGGALGVAPTVTAVDVQSATTVDVTFSEGMGSGVTTAANYAVSSAGAGSLTSNPASVALQSGNIYRLTWTSGEMLTGSDVTITVTSVQDTIGNSIGSPNSGTDSAGGIGVAPTVTTVDVQSGSTVDVTFSEAMGSGVTTAANYAVSGTGAGTLTSNPASVALQSGNTYRLTWTSGEMKTGGNITIAVSNAQDSVGNAIGSPNSGMDTGGGIGVSPSVASVAVQSATTVDVTFSESIGSGVTTAANYTVSGVGAGTLTSNPASVALQSGNTYRLTWTSGEMTNGADVTVTVANVQDSAGNTIGSPTSGTDTGGGIGVAPIVTSVSVQSISTVDVTFSESMGSGVTTAANYAVSGTGAGTLTTNPASVALQSGTTYRLTWTSGEMRTGSDVTITVTVAQDLAGNAIGGPSSGTDTGGGVGTAPTVSMSSTAADPTNVSPISVSVTFSESVTGFVSGDLSPTNATVGNFAGSGSGYTFDLTPSGQGSVSVSIASSAAVDAAGNSNTTGASLTRTYDSVAPTLSIGSPSAARTRSGPITYTLTYSGQDTISLVVGNVTLNTSGTATGSLGISGSGSSRTVTISSVSGNGTLGISIAVGTASDTAGNSAAAAGPSTTFIVDNTAPVITRTGSSPVTVEVGGAYVDVGATASDDVDGVITGTITTVNPVNAAVLGSYTVTYDVSDLAGNAATQVTRTVNVVDTTIPTITRLGANPATVEVGSVYTDAGATAADNYDGVLTDDIVTTNPVNTAVLGAYTVRYNVSDSSLNAAVEVTRTVNVVDTTKPIITRLGSSPSTVEVGAVYTDAGATAADNYDGDLTGDIATTNPVNTAVLGSYTVRYNVSDSSSNAAIEVTRTVNVVDTTKPIITRLGASPVTLEVGSVYTDAGATATDNYDGDLTGDIVTTNPVNTAVVGSYTVRYNVSDSSLNAAVEVTRTVNVVDTVKPVITRLGSSPVSVEAGSVYADAGATATDNYDGDVTGDIVTTNPVNTAVLGAYTVRYNVSDSSGNAAVEVTRTVNVIDTTKPIITRLGSAVVSVEAGSTYTDAGATATDNLDGDLTSSIATVSTVNTAVLGSYTVTYNVSDSSGNAAIEVARTVNVIDSTPPSIILLGVNPATVEMGGVYSDAGAVAIDSYDGVLTDAIVTVNPVNTAIVGTYTVTYNVSDLSDNAAVEVTRMVNVVDSTKPVITRLGLATVTVAVGTAYVDAGATATDNYDGDLTGDIVTTNPVNTAVLGSYTVRYNVSDSSSNAAVEVTRTVNVVDTTKPVITLLGDNPVTVSLSSVYLDAGATAVDNYDGDISSEIIVTGSVNTALVGAHTLFFNVTDSSGNAAVEVTRTVNVLNLGSPGVTIEQAASQSDPADVLPILFDVVFTRDVIGFDASDVEQTGSATGVVFEVAAIDGSHYQLSAVAVATDGAIQPIIPAGVCVDGFGASNSVSSSIDNSVSLERTGPTVTMSSSEESPTNATSIAVSVVFSGNVTGFASTDVTTSNATLANFTGSGADYSFTLQPISDGAVTADIVANVALDVHGNGNQAADTFSIEFISETGTGSISGVLQDNETDERLADVAVKVSSLAKAIERIVSTDANGEYRALNLPAGEYTVETFSPGYLVKVSTATVQEGKERLLHLGLLSYVAGGGVRGVITDETTGLPIVGVQVDAAVDSVLVATTYSSSLGSYELSDLVDAPNTAVSLTFSAQHYIAASANVNVSPTTMTTTNAILAASIAAPASLSGSVTRQSDNAPLANARITILGPINLTTFTDGNGDYAFEALPEGAYSVEASGDGYEGSILILEVTAANQNTQDFTLVEGVNEPQLEDIDGDGNVTAVDVQLVINGALGLSISGDADVDRSGSVNAVDVQLVINAALGIV